jgi:hypothetical protein
MRRLEAEDHHLRSSVALTAMCHSRLSRHVSGLFVCDGLKLSASQLALLATHLPQLHEMQCAVALPAPDEALILPLNLTKLNVDFGEHSSPSQLDAMMRALGQLSLLRDLVLRLHESLCFSFQPLHALPLLNTLLVRSYRWEDLSNAQIDELRAMPHLHTMSLNPEADLLRRLLRTPHSLQWKNVGDEFRLDDECAALLLLLPSLTKLGGVFEADPAFLQQLPNLEELELNLIYARSAPAPQLLLTALQGCSKLTSLFLSSCRFTSEQMCALLPSLPALRHLTLHIVNIVDLLESLRCFSSGPITRTLTKLTLVDCRHPALHLTELEHVHALTELRSLDIRSSFVEPLDAAAQEQYLRRPSRILPKLSTFFYWR